jgi:hypothetical protein
MTAPDVVFHFDPICPWTWMTSRWLTEVAEQRPLTLGFRSLSLRIVNERAAGEQAALDASFEALRVVEALAEAGDHAGAARFYGALGEQVHRGGRPIDRQVVAEVLATVDLPGPIARAVADGAWDERIAESTRTAVEAAGGGIGSPVIRWPSTGRATSGPIVSPPPTGADALRLWDAVTAVLDVPGFYELKRGRSDQQPQIP